MAAFATMGNGTLKMNFLLLLVLLTTLVLFSAPSASASASDHRYNVGDHVPLFVNKVGPLNNPSETYQYYDLPFCHPDTVIQQTETIGEVLNGDRLTNTLYELNFREGKSHTTLCHKKLKASEVAIFRNAVIRDFYFQMYYDDLPLWAFVGKVEEEYWNLSGPKYYLFKHVQFDVVYNDNQVIEIKAFSDPNDVMDITEDAKIDVEFTYSVNWNASSANFKSRMDKYSKASLLSIRQKMHWFSFINSIVIIFLLMGFLTLLIMRRLKNDMRRFSNVDEEEDKEVGWKYIHGDVFRCPSNMSLLSAVLGVGTQLLTLVCILFLLAFFGVFYPYNRGALLTSIVSVYALTSVVGGYTSAAFHNQFSEAGWKRSVLLTGILYTGPLFATMSIVNTIAIAQGVTAALPFGTIVVILLIYFLLAIPLLALGGLIGHRFRSEFSAPSATKPYPREIPPLAWYRKIPSQMLIAGLLPFGAVVLQLHHLYASIWGYKIYTLPGILFVTFVILVILTAILSIGLTYIQLSVEDHRWWWRSVLCGGSTAIFMFGYAIYFYLKSNMDGLMQLLFFIGYNACMAYAFFLVLGTISFCVSLMFVRYIYRAIKSE
ncbi:Putative phagocytic receptor 1b [Morus notabilis]|uniref:Transmembrane 9 superfamily member n=1 Tax=Morus notabilis TaxID=981085 RepID=W9QU46_9ROSA|nr:transmembrane 9 superfamily member 5 [Morus notabilis]EXB38443.1 Putative phagocytic receptor 1b [Morus notabilis]